MKPIFAAQSVLIMNATATAYLAITDALLGVLWIVVVHAFLAVFISITNYRQERIDPQEDASLVTISEIFSLVIFICLVRLEIPWWQTGAVRTAGVIALLLAWGKIIKR